MNWSREFRKRVRKMKGRKSLGIKLGARFWYYGALFSLGLVLLGIVGGVGLFVWYARDLPTPDRIVRREGFSTKIYDREGELLYDIFADEKRTTVTLDRVPEYLRQAAIAIEDKNFYDHQGFDTGGMFRALYNIAIKRKLQGGSTLTQQLVKNVLLTQERVVSRKIREFIIAVQIENKYSKDEILQMYFNEVPYGGTIWGVQAAAETYFNKDVSELSLVEAVILAGLPQSPTRYSPFGSNPQAYIGRAAQVLRRMREDGYLSADQEREVMDELPTVGFAPQEGGFKAPHFVMYVKELLEERYGQKMVEQGGLKVRTSLDWELQETAQAIVAEEIEKSLSLGITNGSVVVLDPETGEILAMVGSRDFFDENYDGQVNVALALRQPGSAIKPITYLAALKRGYTAATSVMDVETVFPVINQDDYVPVNYDGQYRGPVQVRYALGSSLNVPAVKMLARVGLPEMLGVAYEMGLSSLEPTKENLQRLGLSATLGGGEVRLLELVSAYAAFANTGLKVEPVAVLKVEDNNGKVLEEFRPALGRRVMSEGEAFIISDILADNQARLLTFGENSLLRVRDGAVAVKTGTTNDKRDNWAIGWSGEVVVGAWVGNNDNTPMKKVASGVSGATPIWRRIILKALEKFPAENFPRPDEIAEMEVDIISGYQTHDGFPARKEYFVKGTEPVGQDPIHTYLKLCPAKTGLATEIDAIRNNYVNEEYLVYYEDDPVSWDNENRWQAGIEAWVAVTPDARFRFPKNYCESASLAVQLLMPKDKDRFENNEVEIQALGFSVQPLRKMRLFIDNNLREEFDKLEFDNVYTIEMGAHVVKVEIEDDQGQFSSAEVRIGVGVAWNFEPSPTPTATVLPTATPTPTPTATPTV